MSSCQERNPRIARLLSMIAVTLFVPTMMSAGSGIDAGPEIWIDGPDDVEPGNNRNRPDVAVDENGRRIHVWAAFGEVARNDIFLRQFDSQGNPLEDPRLVNTTTDDDQSSPRVAVAGDGSFLVIFLSDEPHPIGVDRDVVRSQAYDANGEPVGTEQLLSDAPLPRALDITPDVAALRAPGGGAGGYAVVWRSVDSSGNDPGEGIEGCLVSSTGVPSAQFQIPSDPDNTQNEPSVVALVDGGFLVTWRESNTQVRGRRFNSAGGPVGNDFEISTSFVAQKLSNDAAIGWDGRVLVVWSDQEDNGGTNEREIYGRLFDSDLNSLGPDFRINTVIDQDQTAPRVADYGPMGFLVVWESEVSSGADTSNSIEARVVSGPNQFDADGDGLDDPQMQLNIWDNGSGQTQPGAQGWYGNAAADWRSLTWNGDPPPTNTQDDFIIGRNVEGCVFCSDMEWHDTGGSGNAWRWSAIVGMDP